jgi:large subunit ribosomal protein L24
MNKLKIGDLVVVTTGRSKGKQGKIKTISFDKNQVVVEGVNLVKKAKKPTQTDQQPGFVEKEAPVHISNIALYSTVKKQASRVGIKDVDGKKVRFLKACNTVI